jgi:phosphoserine phosphatase RsbU/P
LNTAAGVLGPDLERSSRVVTLFHCRLDGANRQFTYANAGHRLGFVRRTDGTLETFEEQGLPLGIMSDVNYIEKNIILAAGDLVIIFSDGLIDAKGGQEIRFNDLADLLSSDLDASRVVERLVEFAVPPGELPDDLTLLVLRCQPENALQCTGEPLRQER